MYFLVLSRYIKWDLFCPPPPQISGLIYIFYAPPPPDARAIFLRSNELYNNL